MKRFTSWIVILFLVSCTPTEEVDELTLFNPEYSDELLESNYSGTPPLSSGSNQSDPSTDQSTSESSNAMAEDSESPDTSIVEVSSESTNATV
ncbi:MAG: hypothetical protein VW080_02045 [Flavobacteriaceae bacterium]